MEKQDMVMLKIFYACSVLFFSVLITVSCTESGSSMLYSDVLPEVSEDLRVAQTTYSLANEEAPIPPQCYTKTEGRHNPCYVCHQKYEDQKDVYRMNKLNDGGIQGGYLFSDIGVTNHWKNLFVDRSEWVASISDTAIKNYISQDNYSDLNETLESINWKGFIPDIENYGKSEQAFESNGVAVDGSGWVAFNYKPLPSTFWPTNGSTDDVLIRLPEDFRTLNGDYNEEVYFTNLSILEMTMKQLDAIDLFAVSEVRLGVDLDRDGVLSESLSHIRSRENYVGDASSITVAAQQFPVGTEFLHSVRYVGVDTEQGIVVPPRMKELRYMKKTKLLSESELQTRFDRERKEKLLEELPSFVDFGDEGLSNGMGWMIQGFIEDYEGRLRPQKFEEKMFCMGCHSAIGSTIDSTFSFARKVTGRNGWGYINLKGMTDAPSISQVEGEILQYLRASAGGNEFRENPEIRSRWFYPDGSLKTSEIKNADVYALITPSKERALALNKAYTHIVRHQSFVHGRDATASPVKNVYEVVDESVAPLEEDYRIYGWDIRLNW